MWMSWCDLINMFFCSCPPGGVQQQTGPNNNLIPQGTQALLIPLVWHNSLVYTCCWHASFVLILSTFWLCPRFQKYGIKMCLISGHCLHCHQISWSLPISIYFFLQLFCQNNIDFKTHIDAISQRCHLSMILEGRIIMMDMDTVKLFQSTLVRYPDTMHAWLPRRWSGRCDHNRITMCL
jgi:hypothetical protein